jgi:hypothetical protein
MCVHSEDKPSKGQSKRVILAMRYGRVGVADGGSPVF